MIEIPTCQFNAFKTRQKTAPRRISVVAGVILASVVSAAAVLAHCFILAPVVSRDLVRSPLGAPYARKSGLPQLSKRGDRRSLISRFAISDSTDEAEIRAEVNSMKGREIKQELEANGVNTADLFEKVELAERLVQLRMAGPPSSNSSPSAATVESSGSPSSQTDMGALLQKCREMKVVELRTELGTRGISWADALDKDDLVQRLAEVLAKEGEYCRSGRVSPGKVAQISGDELDEELKDSSTPILLDVYATWCGPCQLMAPHLEAAAKKLGSRVRVVKMDSDANPQMSTRLRVGGLPTLILYNRDGVEATRQEGALMEAQLIDMVNNAGV